MAGEKLASKIRDRAMVQWALAYLAGAWAFLEIVSFAAEQFAWPSIITRALALLALVGFFITLVLAWYHGEQGRQRVSGPELLMVAALLVIAGVVLSGLAPESGPAEPAEGAPAALPREGSLPRVAVLPCTNESPDPEDPYRATGLHDEILLKLQKISSLESIGRMSVVRFADAATPTPEIASELSADYIGECTVQRLAPRIRVIFQLLDAVGVQVWADEYDRDLTLDNVLDIQIDVARQVAIAIGAALTPEEANRIAVAPTDNLTAYELYQAGRARWMARWGRSLDDAIGFFRAAIVEDPTFALAHAGLAQAHMLLPLFSERAVDVHEEFARAKEAVGRALDLNPDLSEAHAAVGYIAHAYDWDWEAAERHFLRAIELNPGNAETRGWYSALLYRLHRTEEAQAQAAKGVALDPFSWAATNAALNAATEEGIEYYENLIRSFLATNPNHRPAEFALSVILLLGGRNDEAGDVAKELWDVSGFAGGDSMRVLYQSVGDTASWDRARQLLRFFKEELTDVDARAFTAFFHRLMGDYEAALEDARYLVESRSYYATDLGGPDWAPLHEDPRFLELIDEVGLPRPGG